MDIYKDIATRTGGDIYIGVVGPVRTGKSTFIERFMDELVIPNIGNAYTRERTRDELPQSAGGRTIMTTEPKFIPNEAVEINLSDNSKFNVRMIDCVGYVVESALGHIEEEMPRMVKTPWFEEEIPFAKAAEIGTKKVIDEHSTIGIVVTTDGSVTDIAREDYLEAEGRVINELKEINKPFVVLLNSQNPNGESAVLAKESIESTYDVPVMPINCARLQREDIMKIIEFILFEFPLKEIGINIPKWIEKLNISHWLKRGFYDKVLGSIEGIKKISDGKKVLKSLGEYEYTKKAEISEINLGDGTMIVDITTDDELFYKVLGETTGFEINGQDSLITLMQDLSEMKKEYDKVATALKDVNEYGYGIVSPVIEDLSLEEPEIVKQGGQFGVRLRASAPSIHMIRADIETEVSPIVGTEKQSEDLVHYMLNEFEIDPIKIWESNIFGKSLHELVNEGLHNKPLRMPEDAQHKLQETLQKIINEGSGGLICILL